MVGRNDVSSRPETTSDRPIGVSESPVRLLSPDLARGSLLLVIAAAHAPAYLVPPPDLGVVSGPDRIIGAASVLLVEGRGYPVFACLFGYGVVQFARRFPDWGAASKVLRRRGVWLIAFGAAHAALLWSGDILGAYGVLLLGGAAILTGARDQTLAILCVLSVGVVALGGASMAAVRSSLSDAALPPWWAAGERLVDWLPTLVVQPLGLAGAALLGALAARHYVLEEPQRHAVLLSGVAVGGLLAATVGGLPRMLLDVGVLSPTPWMTGIAGGLHAVSGYGGIGYAAVAALVAGSALGSNRAVRAVAACGERSLSSYLAQSVLFTVAMSPALGRVGERVGILGAAAVALGVWATTVAGAELLRRHRRRGPAEAGLRRLVRWAQRPGS